MTDWNVRRWARYGHERLYAETPGGTALGYYDVKTCRYHSDDSSNLPMLQQAIAEHLASRDPAPPPLPAPSEPTPTLANSPQPATPMPAAPAPPTWHDISANRAGAAARERAMAEREAQGTFKHVLSRLVGARTEERAWRIGADGEEAVAAQLLALGPAWRVLHAVRVGERGSDIDHVVVGPPGVFTVNAKHHPNASIWVGGDTLMVNGQRVPYIRNSRHEARRAARLLTEHAGFPVTAAGVIAVMGARKGFKVWAQPEDGVVVVVTRRRISQHLLSQPLRLSPREIDAIYDVARRSTTWHS
ncbi:NERD domain-containing protein [Nocardioides carbamazepini]|uniref:nuclease-related domain-containing protein n=1 Tax=Nocardioides carbamazepini TaxID=2854259 RepID=UPI00214A5991|nr:nuclease-related domain-containing protein [Nocardioides carbamazepini]MCR1785401.1 NERD domain-containing protein [Nocardioides carbamazepini]